MDQFLTVLVVAPGLLIGVILHEIAHGWVAEKLGDPTARSLGRITLNPIKHIDPFMTLLVPGMLIMSGSPVVFGGAKPVPVNPSYFKDPRKGMCLVAVAGPVVNLVIASISLLAVHLLASWMTSKGLVGIMAGSIFYEMLVYSVLINVILAAFNLLPVPPLDGGRIMVGILPEKLAHKWAQLERFGLLIVIVFLFSGGIGYVLDPVFKFVLKLLPGAALS